MMTTKIKAGHCVSERASVRGCEVIRGYVYYCRPGDDASLEGRYEGAHEEDPNGTFCFGYHGGDLPPCNAEWVGDIDGEHGFLVAADSDSADEIETVDGWILEPCEDEIDYADGAGTTKTVYRHGHEHVLALCY